MGLGNPGPRYSRTRHNVGFRTVELLAKRLRVNLKRALWKNYLLAAAHHAGGVLYLVKPLTYMNRSGQIFPDLWSQVKGGAESLLVVCDTLDLPPGQCRLRRKGSSAGHKGLSSIIASLGREDFMRLYIGIGRPGLADREEVPDYVLTSPQGEEAERIEEAVATAAEAVLRLLAEEPEKVMNALNQKRAGS